MRRSVRLLSIFGIALSLVASSVLTQSYGNLRTGANTSESLITRSNVSRMYQQCAIAVDGNVSAQSLIFDTGTLRTLIVVTLANSLYAFNADTCASIWHVNVGTPAANFNIAGCMATPVIDPAKAVVYAVCQLLSGSTWKLYAYNIGDGTQYAAPVAITASSNGISFNSANQTIRPGLLLSGGAIYIGAGAGVAETSPFTSLPFQGWLFKYDSTTLSQLAVWCSTCASSGVGGGIWMSGGGLSTDSLGNIYAITGNGTWDGVGDFGETYLKFDSSLNLVDFFTPTNWATLNTNDSDTGSNRMLLISDSRIVSADKTGRFWFLDATNMGHLQSGGVGPVQTWTPDSNNQFDGYVFANNSLFVSNSNDASFYKFDLSGTFATTPSATGTVEASYPSSLMLTYSSNSGSDGILWGISKQSSDSQATLHAYNSDDLTELWNSGHFGAVTGFVTPIVANGKVFVTDVFNHRILVFGLAYPGIRGSATVRNSLTIR